MKKYLVTGGTGFLGAALVQSLVKNGDRVRVLDNNSRGSLGRLGEVAEAVEFLEGDIRDPETVKNALRGMESVCHLAYVNGTRFFYEKPAYVLEVAVKGMMNVLDGCLANGVGELILASSSEVYQVPPQVPTAEDVPLVVPNPHNPRYSYGGGKIICELLALNYGRSGLERVVIFRPHNVYGPQMGWEHVIPEFVLRMRELVQQHPAKIPFPIQGNGQETRAFIYIDDFTHGLMQIIRKGEHLGIYHIGTMEETPVAQIAREVGRFYAREVEIIAGPLQLGSTPRRCPDTSRLQALGFAPQISLEQGIRLTTAWYDANAHLKP
jgi:dTDP-glucose 4,6-dehydratase/UDP-glucose 4-epimerase